MIWVSFGNWRIFLVENFSLCTSLTIFFDGQVKNPCLATDKERNCLLGASYAYKYEALSFLSIAF